MALDFFDIFYIEESNRRNGVQNREESRRRNIEDNFGIKTQSMEEWRKAEGLETGFWKSMGILAVGGIMTVATAFIPIVSLIAMVATAAAWYINEETHRNKITSGYDKYLDGAAAEGRAMQGRGNFVAQEYKVPTRRQSHEQDIMNQRSPENTVARQNERT